MGRKKNNTKAFSVGMHIKIECWCKRAILYPILYTIPFPNGVGYAVSEIDFGCSQNVTFALDHNRRNYIAGSKDFAHRFKFESDSDIWRSSDDFFDLR